CRHRISTPSLCMKHSVPSRQKGLASSPVHMATHVPCGASGSTSQQTRPMSHESMPDEAEPVAVHGSPACPGSSTISEQRLPFHAPLPSLECGMHFSPSGQSCANTSQQRQLEPPPSGRSRKTTPSSVLSGPLNVASPVLVLFDVLVLVDVLVFTLDVVVLGGGGASVLVPVSAESLSESPGSSTGP